MTTANTQQATNPTLKAFQEQISAKVQEAKARLDQVEAKAREKKSEAELAAAVSLKKAKQNIDRKLQELSSTSDAYMARAKAEINADVAAFKASVDEIAAKIKTQATRK